MIYVIAVDDEVNALGIITEFSKKIPDLVLVQAFTDPVEALRFMETTPQTIHLLFLDIQMNRMNGLSLAGHLPASCRVILTTAYPDYALQGYELDVVDYLLKPFSFTRFERAVQKVRSLTGSPDRPDTTTTPRQLSPAADDFIFVRTEYKTLKVRISEILYIEGSGNYVTLHLVKGKVMVLQNLKKFEEQLLPYQFVRIHKSFIVSLNHIDSIEKGWIQVRDKEVPIGESYRETFQQFLHKNYKQF